MVKTKTKKNEQVSPETTDQKHPTNLERVQRFLHKEFGICDIRFLWSEHDEQRFRLNFWSRKTISKSMFIKLKDDGKSITYQNETKGEVA